MFLLMALQTLLIPSVLSHPPLDFDIVNSRTCPYANDMNQRLANMAEYIYKASNNIPYGITKEKFDDRLDSYIYSNEMQMILFPSTIKDSESYFTLGAFQEGLLDLSKHSSWSSMDAITNGISNKIEENEQSESFGQASDISFYDFLSNLEFGVKIVGTDGYYYCDEEHGWGFNQATVYIKEKIEKEDLSKICTPKMYIGTAEIYPTFTREDDEWKLGEYSVFWDIYSVEDAVECEGDVMMENGVRMESIVGRWKSLKIGYNEVLYGALAFVCVLCACAVISVYCCNNDKQRYERLNDSMDNV